MKRILAIMATAALVCTGCHNHGEEHHEDEHAHSHSSVQVVSCAEGVELFAESAIKYLTKIIKICNTVVV